MHLPLFRHGEVYVSAEHAPIPDLRGGHRATVSMANAGLLRRDVRRAHAAREALRGIPASELAAKIAASAALFRDGVVGLPGAELSADEHVAWTSSTTGMPHALVRHHLRRVASVVEGVAGQLHGLMRGLPLDALDRPVEHAGVRVGLVQRARTLAAILPSNSPGVHGLWVAVPALKTPLVLKPGRGDPWTPARLVGAAVAAGVPPEVYGFYPTDHEGSEVLTAAHERVMLFGGEDVARRHAGDPRVEVHGPGWSKVVIDADVPLDDALIDALVRSVAAHGGRSCINASTIVVIGDPRDERRADAVAAAVAERLAAMVPRDLDDPEAQLCAFADPDVARRIDAALGPDDLVPGPRCVERDGLTFLRPSVRRCKADDPRAKVEYPFPCVAAVTHPREGVVGWLGSTLGLMLVTSDPALEAEVLDARHVDRVHLPVGGVAEPTSAIRWDQPHEGNLFEALWRRRALG